MAAADGTGPLVDALFEGMGVRERDVQLIRLYADRQRDALQWEAFFKTVRLEREPYVFNYLLSRLAVRHGWDAVPDGLAPMLMGVHRKFIANNAALLARALRFVRVLNDAGDVPLVVRGGAMRLGLLPGIPQKMTDVDVVVPRERYKACRAAALEAGFESLGYSSHSTGFAQGDEQCCDLHYTVFKCNIHKDEPTGLVVSRGAEASRNGARFLLPSVEDAFLVTMVNAVDNYLTIDKGKGPITWLADLVDLSEQHDIRYADVAAHAREYGVWAQFRTALALMERFLPDGFAELHALAGGPVPKRLVRRVKTGMRYFATPQDEVSRYSTVHHLAHTCRFVWVEHRTLYNLDDSFGDAWRGFCTAFRHRLDTEYGVKHIWQLPGVVFGRTRHWAQRREGEDPHDQVQ